MRISNPPTVVGALGDSITAGTPLWDPNPAVQTDIGDALDEQSSWPYWAERKQEGIVIRNHGVNLEKTGQIATRLDEATNGVDVLVVQGGINDIVLGDPVSQAAENLASMVVRGIQLGLGVLIIEVLPCNGFPDAAPAIVELNDRIGVLAREYGATVLPFYSTLEDPAVPLRIHPDWTDDGNHPSVAGHRRLGELAFRLP